MKVSNQIAVAVVYDLIQTIQDGKTYLSELDGAIGDGDHGINMNKGFTLCGERLQQNPADLSHGLGVLGDTLMADIGGSMGPLYGMFFTALANVCQSEKWIDGAVFGRMLDAGLEMVISIGNAKRGDKTLLDTLIPACEAYHAALNAGQSFTSALTAMKRAAAEGRDATKAMIAKVGRASRLGERSRGIIDAGAASCYLILGSMADSLVRLCSQTSAVKP